jgi:GAF domain-containing protein
MEPVPETRSALEGLAGEDRRVVQALQAAIDAVTDTIRECVGVSISVRETGMTFTFLRSSGIAGAIDAAQYLDDGPCLETIRTGDDVSLTDLMDEDRWQLFAQASAASGVRSSLSLPLRRNGEIVGSVNFYGSTSWAFMGEEAALARAFGARVEDAINNADLSMSTLAAARQAPQVLADRTVVDQALGVLVAKLGIGFEEALQRLSTAAAHARVPLAELARVVIDTMHH